MIECDFGVARLPKRGARVFNSANLSISSGVTTTLTFDSERFDYGGFHSTVTNTARLTAPAAGLYLIGASIRFAGNATGVRSVVLRLNGTTGIASNQHDAGSTSTWREVLNTLYELAATDYAEVRVFQDSTVSLNVLASANESPEFWMMRLAQ